MPTLRSPRRRTVPKSFRIDQSAAAAVEREAAARNISSNTLVNQILTQFAEFDRFTRRINTVEISASIFRSLLEGMEEGRVIDLAKSTGSSIPQAFANSRTGKVTTESLLDHLRLSGKYGHWYEFNEAPDPQNALVTLVHELGLNWSIFLVHYVTAMFEQIGISPRIEMSDRSVAFTLPNKK